MKTGFCLRALLVTCMPLLFVAAARESFPGALPSLQPQITLPLAASQPLVRWQLHQQLDHSFHTGQGRLSFMPSLSVVVHDPQSDVRLRQEQASSELQLLELRSEAQRSALTVHLDYLQLQNRNRSAQFLREWLSDWSELPAGSPEQAARARLHYREAEDLLLDAGAHARLLSLQLESRGYTAGPQSRDYLRPLVVSTDDPLLKCLQASPAVRRLEVLNQLEQLSQEHAAAGRQLRVELELRGNVSLTQTAALQPGTSAGFNAGLRVSRADHSEPRLQFDVSDQSISQSFTIRGPSVGTAATHDPAAALGMAADNEVLRLVALVAALEQAGRQENLARESLALELDIIRQREAASLLTRHDLYPVLQAVLTLQQLELHHDQLTLELAAECALPLDYVEVSGLP